MSDLVDKIAADCREFIGKLNSNPAWPMTALPDANGPILNDAYELGVQAGRRQILAEQAANRQILQKHWEK